MKPTIALSLLSLSMACSTALEASEGPTVEGAIHATSFKPNVDKRTKKCAPPVPNHASETRVNFLAFGDSQYGSGSDVDRDQNELNVRVLNRVFRSSVRWPKSFKMSTDTIRNIRGVLVAGDITNNARDAQFEKFEGHYGLCGSDGLFEPNLSFPVFEGYGNHDYVKEVELSENPIAPKVAARTEVRSNITRTTRASRAHYSWDWDNIHFVNVNVKPSNQIEHLYNDDGDTKRVLDPEKALRFLKNDLRDNVGSSNKGVVIMTHYPIYDRPNNRLDEEERDAFHDAIKDYNVIAIVAGHTHKSGKGEFRDIDVIEVGGPFYRKVDEVTGEERGHVALFRITNNKLKVQDLQWGVVDGESADWDKKIDVYPNQGWSLIKNISIP